MALSRFIPAAILLLAASLSSTVHAQTTAATCTPLYYACSNDAGCAGGNVCVRSGNAPLGNCYCPGTTTTTTIATVTSPPVSTCTNGYYACVDNAGCSGGNTCRKSPNEPVGNCYCPATTATTTTMTVSTCTNQYFACANDAGCSNGNVCRKGPNQPVGNCYCHATTGITAITTTPATTSTSMSSAPTCTNQYFACSNDAGCSNGNICRKGPNQPVGNCYCPATTVTSSSTAAPATCTNEYFACSDDAGCSNGNVCRKSANQPVGNCYCPPTTAITATIASTTSSSSAPSCTNQYFACSNDAGCSNGNVCRKGPNQPVGNCYCPASVVSTITSSAVVVVTTTPTPTPAVSTVSVNSGPRKEVGLVGAMAAWLVVLI